MNLYYTKVEQRMSAARMAAHLQLLPPALVERISRFKQWQDAQASISGLLLLQQALRDCGPSNLGLGDLRYNNCNRPYFDHNFDFNISHSGKYVVCACCFNNAVGVDVEQVTPIDIHDFRSCWTDHEWRRISHDHTDYHVFFDYWTKKEAVVKAIGDGLNIPLQQINIYDNRAESSTHGTWFLEQLSFHPQYKAHLATRHPLQTSITWKEIFFACE